MLTSTELNHSRIPVPTNIFVYSLSSRDDRSDFSHIDHSPTLAVFPILPNVDSLDREAELRIA